MEELLKLVHEKGQNTTETANILSHWNKGTGIKKSAVVIGCFPTFISKKIIEFFSYKEKSDLAREILKMPNYSQSTVEEVLKHFIQVYNKTATK